MYYDTLKIGAAAAALGLFAYAGYAGAISTASMAEERGRVVLAQGTN